MVDRIQQALRKKQRRYEAQLQFDLDDDDYTSHVGREGEVMVYELLKQPDNFIINNFTFYAAPEQSVQIDHILINTTGIHVIETKIWSGIVSGDYGDSTWILRNRDNTPTQCINAFRQNEYHVRELKRYLQLPVEYDYIITNMLALVNLQQIELSFPECYDIERYDRIVLVHTSQEPAITANAMDEIYWLLRDKNQHIPKEEHIKNVKRYIEKTKKRDCGC